MAPAALCGLLLALILATGCVTRGKYGEVKSERDALAQRVSQLEVTEKSLDSQRVQVLEEAEDLRIQKEQLDRELRKLRKAEEDLSTRLAAREQELAKASEEVVRLRSTYEGLVADLESEVAAGAIEIEQLRDGLRLNLSQDVLFPPGASVVDAKGQAVLAKVADRVKEIPHRVVVQGHTDNVPIQTQRFPSNWELAGARAAGVVRLLASQGVEPDRLSAVSFGEFSPRASNDDGTGRARNRRIEITLRPMDTGDAAASTGPQAEAASAGPKGPEAAPEGAAAAP